MLSYDALGGCNRRTGMVEQWSNAVNQGMGRGETRRLRENTLLAIGVLCALGVLTSIIGGGSAPLFYALLLVIVLLLCMVAFGEREDRRWLLLTLTTLLCVGLLIGREA